MNSKMFHVLSDIIRVIFCSLSCSISSSQSISDCFFSVSISHFHRFSYSSNKIYVSDVSSFVCRRIGWQDDDQGSLLIIAAVPPYHRPGSVIKTCAHTLESEFSRALLISSNARMFCHTWHIETAAHLKAHKSQSRGRFNVWHSKYLNNNNNQK